MARNEPLYFNDDVYYIRVVRLILTLFISLVLSCAVELIAQDASKPYERPNQSISVSPLQVIRNIDNILGPTKLEAMQSRQNTEYAEQVNISKSFVHAGKIDEAEASYNALLDLIWGAGNHENLSQSIHVELTRSNRSLSNVHRPNGLDENYQPTDEVKAEEAQQDQSYYPQDAANKIDYSLEFLLASVYRSREEKLTLMGHLEDCRQLVLMEKFDEAKHAYHNTIIKYLDPKWTGELLEDINQILTNTKCIKTRSELESDLILSDQQAMDEIDQILSPLRTYYSENQVLAKELKDFKTLIIQRNEDEALSRLNKALIPFADSTWVEDRIQRVKRILERRPGSQTQEQLEVINRSTVHSAPILYFTENEEGRQIEKIRIIENGQLLTYKKVTHNWGGSYFFINDEPAKDTEWLRVWRLYQVQQGMVSEND